MGKVTTTHTTESDQSWTSARFTEEVTLLNVHCVYTSSADVGNRQIVMSITDGTNVLTDTHAGAVQAASNAYHYEFFPGIYRETSFVANALNVPFPANIVIPANYYLKIEASSGGNANDSMVIAYQTETR